MRKKKLPPIHPGQILLEEFIEPMKISQYRLAKDIGVSPRRINEIIQGKRSITADTALRLGFFFDMSPEFWMNLQTHYELELERDRLEHSLKTKIHAFKPASENVIFQGRLSTTPNCPKIP